MPQNWSAGVNESEDRPKASPWLKRKPHLVVLVRSLFFEMGVFLPLLQAVPVPGVRGAVVLGVVHAHVGRVFMWHPMSCISRKMW